MPRLTLAQAGRFGQDHARCRGRKQRHAWGSGGGGSQDYPDVIGLDIAKGRFFTAPESNAGRAVAVVGHQVAMQLFEEQIVWAKPSRSRAPSWKWWGCLSSKASLVSSGFDESMMVPSTFAPRIFDVGGDEGTQISIKARPGVDMEALKSELIQQFRSVRRVRPGRENDFAVNHMDFVASS